MSGKKHKVEISFDVSKKIEELRLLVTMIDLANASVAAFSVQTDAIMEETWRVYGNGDNWCKDEKTGVYSPFRKGCTGCQKRVYTTLLTAIEQKK